MQKSNQSTLLRILKSLFPWVLFFGLLLLTLKAAHAQSYLGTEWDRYLQNVRSFTPTTLSGEELAINLVLNGIRIIRNIVGGVALIMGILYGLRLVLARGQEEVIAKQKSNFIYALLGFMILIISENVALIFNPERATSEQLIDFNAARDQLRDIVDYIKWLLGSVIVLMMTISSVRMILSRGDQEEITKQKRNLTWSLLGMLLILLANNIVNAVYVINSPTEVVAAGAEAGITEFTGIIRLILVFMGPLAIAFTIYAGFVYLTALENEEQASKGRRMIVWGIVAIVTIYGAYAIVNTITGANLEAFNLYLA